MRLWPLSRRDKPKQLAPIISGRSLFALAVERAHVVASPERTMVCASASYMEAIRAASPATPPELLLAEPMGRDTLSAIGFAAAALQARDPEAEFCVLTADHLIEPIETFASCVEAGFELLAERPDRLVTFAIAPTYPATGYGYIRKGEPVGRASCPSGPASCRVVEYVEKPDRRTAERYLASGEFGWNSGMFVWRAETFLAAVERFEPTVRAGLDELARAWSSDEREETLARVYPALKKISVDYSILEPASRAGSGFEVCAVEMRLSWRDVGSWPSFAETLPADTRGVRIAGAGATALDCRDTLIVSDDRSHHVAAIGVTGLVIVHTQDATLIMPAAEAERLKDLHAMLPEYLK